MNVCDFYFEWTTEKLDIGAQIKRVTTIEELESDGFSQKTFKTTAGPLKLDDIPLPALELKPVNLSNLDKEILCHPSVSVFFPQAFGI